MSASSQYILFWYIAETVPSLVEEQLNASMLAGASAGNETPYQYPPPYPVNLTFNERLKLESEGYEPMHHPNTAVNQEEALYESYLLPVQEAISKLKGSVQADVVASGWEAICTRYEDESKRQEARCSA